MTMGISDPTLWLWYPIILQQELIRSMQVHELPNMDTEGCFSLQGLIVRLLPLIDALWAYQYDQSSSIGA